MKVLSDVEKENLRCGMCNITRKNHPHFNGIAKCKSWVPPAFCSMNCCPDGCECEDCGGCD